MGNDRGRLVQEREFDIFDLLEGVWRQRWLVLAVTVVVTALFAIYAMVITPIYQAKVLLQAPLEAKLAV